MPSPMVNATLQAAVLSSCSNILAQIIDAYRSSVSHPAFRQPSLRPIRSAS